MQALLDAQAAGLIPNGRIVTVVSSREGVFALERAKAHGIPSVVLKKKDFESPEAQDRALIAHLRAHDVGLVVLAGYLSIISGAVVAAFHNRILNVHPALIPAFSGPGCYGLHVHERVLAQGVKLTGATVHFVNEEVDGGAIVLQKAVAVQSGDTAEQLQRRVMEEAEWQILPRAVSLFCAGRLQINNRWVEVMGEDE